MNGAGSYWSFKQLNTPSCNAGYDPVEDITFAMSGC